MLAFTFASRISFSLKPLPARDRAFALAHQLYCCCYGYVQDVQLFVFEELLEELDEDEEACACACV